MSDNANKMGTSMESIKNAYQGFAKQNYTMLDNLKLGYGGTKSEMERLLADAQKLTGVKYDINNLSDVYDAIHAIQEETGITGTTAEEAEKTIEGSTKMMKASWQNVLTSLVTGGKFFDESLKGLTDSVKAFAKNVTPAFTAALKGVSALVSNLAPVITEEIPNLVANVLPGFIDAVSSILDSILDALPSLLETLRDVAPLVSDALVDLVPKLVDFILEGIPTVVDAGLTLLKSLVSGLADNIDTIVPQLTKGMIDMVNRLGDIIGGGGVGLADAGLKLMSGLANALVEAVPSVSTQITQMIQDLTANIKTASEGESYVSIAIGILTDLASGLVDNIATIIPQLTSAAAEFISEFAAQLSSDTTTLVNSAIGILNKLVTGLSDSIPQVMTDLTTAAVAIVEAIVDAITGADLSTFLDAAVTLVTSLANGITDSIGVITAKLPELITGLVTWLTNPANLEDMLTAAISVFGAIVSNVPKILSSLADGLAGIVTGIAGYFTEHKEEILTGLKNAFNAAGEKLTEVWDEKIKPAFDELGEKLRGFFDQFDWGQALLNFLESIKTGISDIWEKVKDAFSGADGLGAKIKNFFGSFSWGETLTTFVSGIGTGIKGAWDTLKDIFTGEDGFFGKVKGWFGDLNLVEIGTNIINDIKTGLENAWKSVESWFVEKGNSIGDFFAGIFGGKKNDKNEGKGEEVSSDSEQLTTEMPAGMMTLDYTNLEPIPEDTLTSYQLLADAINTINMAIVGSGEEGSLGLNAALAGLPALFTNVLTAAQNLANYLSTGFVEAINQMLAVVCMTTTDEEGNVKANNGNTLYNALGEVYGLFQDILAAAQKLAQYWSGEFVVAAESLKYTAGHVANRLTTLMAMAVGTANAFLSLAEAIMAAVAALLLFKSITGGGSSGGNNGGGNTPPIKFAAKGSYAHAGDTFIVGENGPELFSPSRSGYIIPNDKLRGGQSITVNVAFNGDVIGDEKSISGYVTRAATRAIQEAVYAAV